MTDESGVSTFAFTPTFSFSSSLRTTVSHCARASSCVAGNFTILDCIDWSSLPQRGRVALARLHELTACYLLSDRWLRTRDSEEEDSAGRQHFRVLFFVCVGALVHPR